MMTIAGFFLGLGAALAIASGSDRLALLLLLTSRIADGLDGAVARATTQTDRGGYLDIVCDFTVYGAIPLAFIFRDQAANGLAGSVLLFAFYVNGASFLGFASLAAKHGLSQTGTDKRSIHFSAGLVEGTETILFFMAMMVFPSEFAILASVCALLTFVTALGRIRQAWLTFKE